MRACADAATWPKNIRVAVNLSAVQFSSDDLLTTVTSAIDESGLDACQLELEVTETVVLQDTDATLSTLHRIRDLGVHVALDDFGTGYSSLSYLRSFPFDKIKGRSKLRSRSWPRSLQSDVIMQTVLDLCAGLGMTSTVEGVETSPPTAVGHTKGMQAGAGKSVQRACPCLSGMHVAGRSSLKRSLSSTLTSVVFSSLVERSPGLSRGVMPVRNAGRGLNLILA